VWTNGGMLFVREVGIPRMKSAELFYGTRFSGKQAGRFCSHAAVTHDSLPPTDSRFALSTINGGSMFFSETSADYCPNLARLGD